MTEQQQYVKVIILVANFIAARRNDPYIDTALVSQKLAENVKRKRCDRTRANNKIVVDLTGVKGTRAKQNEVKPRKHKTGIAEPHLNICGRE